MKYNKKSLTLAEMYPAVLAIVLIGIVLGVGLYILSEFRVSIGTETTGVDNANATVGTNATKTLSNAGLTGYYLKSVDTVSTANDTVVSYTNFTYSHSGVLTFGADILATSDFMNISSTYIYDVTDSPEAATNTFITGLSGFSAWIAIIVVVIAAAVVLGVVLSSFGRRTSI